MMGLGEHVHGLKFFDGKGRAGQFAQIPAQGGWVAGDINQPFTGEGGKVARMLECFTLVGNDF